MFAMLVRPTGRVSEVETIDSHPSSDVSVESLALLKEKRIAYRPCRESDAASQIHAIRRWRPARPASTA